MARTDCDHRIAHANALDRQAPKMPSVDRPWDTFKEVFRRANVRKGDRATHRAYHNLYEDMLN